MKIDLHIHTSTGSDGAFTVDQVFQEARLRGIDVMSITDHDSVEAQQQALQLADESAIVYLTGIELNVTFPYSDGPPQRSLSLDFLGYGYDIDNRDLRDKLLLLRERREARALEILDRLNAEFEREGLPRFTPVDLENIQRSVDGAFGRPHIANYLVQKGIVQDRQQAFDRYLVRCDVPKYPLSLAEASSLIRNAGGVLVHAHPNDPNGTSLAVITHDLNTQIGVIEEHMLPYIDGVECWHPRHDQRTIDHYVGFAKRHNLLMTGGTDCHQNPVLMGTLDIPDWVVAQFEPLRRRV